MKALVLTVVERLHAKGWGGLYDGMPSDITQVTAGSSTVVCRI